MAIENTAIPQQGGVKGGKVDRSLWLAICETVVGRRRKATEGLAMMGAVADLSANRVVLGTTRQGMATMWDKRPARSEPHAPGAEIG